MKRMTLQFVCLCVLAPPAEAAIKCWVNGEGVKECGTSVPPEYSQQGHSEVNEQGVVVEEKARPKTVEEFAAEEEAQRAAAEAEAAAVQEKERQEAADRVLLDTFASEDDIHMTRDGKLANIQSQIKFRETEIVKLQKSLDQRIEEAANAERAGSAPAEQITTDIDALRRQLADQRRFIDDKRAEQEAVRREYDDYLERFRRLGGR